MAVTAIAKAAIATISAISAITEARTGNAAHFFATAINTIIERDHQIGGGRIARPRVADVVQSLRYEIRIVLELQPPVEPRIVRADGIGLALCCRHRLKARDIGLKRCRASAQSKDGNRGKEL